MSNSNKRSPRLYTKIVIASVFAFVLAAASVFAADESAEKTISKSFDVKPGGDLYVQVDQGDIQVTAGEEDSVQVVVERDTSGLSESRAKSALKNHKVKITHDGNTVRVEGVTGKSHSLFSHSQSHLNVHFRITVPKHFNITLDTAGGGIEVTGVRGTVDVQTSGGDLRFANVDGPIEGHTSGGNIRAEGCMGKLLVQTSGGNISIKKYSGPSVTADTMGGNIEANDCEGKLGVKTSGGNITVGNFTGDGIFADTTGGTISFDLAKQPDDQCVLRTSGGNVNVRLGQNIAVNVLATTDGGVVNSEIPVSSTVQGKVKEGRLEGKINSGGPLLTLRTSGGNIYILKR
ncbi:MAG TPA: DUF4097 family beta strand repeat-containing protein [Verrucomicrobiae bacterium]|nr:DUF4097 family beta strand repeat-containing protein [Verrucomicrobiae bacterium]